MFWPCPAALTLSGEHEIHSSTTTPAAESHAEAAREAAEFERVLGKDLQQQLKRSVEADRTTSYVKPFWDAMYLGGRYVMAFSE